MFLDPHKNPAISRDLIESWLWVYNSASGDGVGDTKNVLCVTGTVFGDDSDRGVYARALLFHETVYLCSGFVCIQF